MQIRFSGSQQPTNPHFKVGDRAVYINSKRDLPILTTITNITGHQGKVREASFKRVHRDEVDQIEIRLPDGQSRQLLVGEIEFQHGPQRQESRYPSHEWDEGLFTVTKFLTDILPVRRRWLEQDTEEYQAKLAAVSQRKTDLETITDQLKEP